LNLLVGYILLEVFLSPAGEAEGANTQAKAQFKPPSLPMYEIGSVLDYTEIIDRPLFNEERLPAQSLDPDQSITTKPATQGRNPSLIGIILRPEKAEVLLRIPGKEDVALASLGEVIDGWKIERIEAESVILNKGGQELRLDLERTSVEIRQDKRRTSKTTNAPIRPQTVKRN